MLYTLIFALGVTVVAAAPVDYTPRPATAAERAVFRTFEPPVGVIGGKPEPWVMNEYAVAGPYALIGFSNTHAGITAFLVKKAGVWHLLMRGGGQILWGDMVRLAPEMPIATAKSLEKLAESQDTGG